MEHQAEGTPFKDPGEGERKANQRYSGSKLWVHDISPTFPSRAWVVAIAPDARQLCSRFEARLQLS